MSVEMFISILSLILAIIALILVFVFRLVNIEKIVEKLVSIIEIRYDVLSKSIDSHIEKATEVSRQLQRISDQGQKMRPGLSIFLTTQWEFIEKIFHRRHQKHNIARKVVNDHINDKDIILLDSGSTTDLITSELLDKQISNVKIYSNNVSAAINLVGTKKISFYLFGGYFDDRYAAVYSEMELSRLEMLGINIFVLAATAIRYESGIMVHKSDDANYKFKQKALEEFYGKPNAKLIIAVDASKFYQPIEQLKGVTLSDRWAQILKDRSSDIVIITSQYSPDLDVNKRAAIDAQIELFRNNGIKVEFT